MKVNEHSPELVQFVIDRKVFWWWVSVEKLPNLGLASIVEGTLNYGDIPDIKLLFELVGIETVADVFFENVTNRVRINYFPRTTFFFTLYFCRHVSKYFDQNSTRTNAAS